MIFFAYACFGTTDLESPSIADIISAVEFDHDGQHLATGDRGGRVVLFERANVAPTVSTLSFIIVIIRC